MRNRTPATAFTLIELLVVVAIIVALLAILMPSMGRAIMVAELAACTSNARQLHLAHLTYLTDSFGVHATANQYIGLGEPEYPSGSIFIKQGYMSGSVDVFMCPADDGTRTDHRALQPAGHSYARNYSPLGGTAHLNPKQSMIERPAETPLLMEELETSPMNDGYVVPSQIDNVSVRHFDQGNFVYFDGHVGLYDAIEYNALPDLLRRKVMDPTYPY